MKSIRRDGSQIELDEQGPAVVTVAPKGSGTTTLDLLSSDERQDLVAWAHKQHVGLAEDEAIDLSNWPGWRRPLATHQSRVIVASMSLRELLARLVSQ